jgi:SnoaL-like domain
MAKSVEQTLTELADREAIRELPQRYCDCVWRGDIPGVVDLFTDDGAFIVVGRKRENKTAGRAELLKVYSTLTAGDVLPRPYIHNHVIDLKGGGRATGRCYVELRSAKLAMEWLGSGYYEDEYTKVGEEWKFASRRLIEIGMGPSLRTFMVS